MISILWNLSAFLISLSFIVTVHEFGHFYAARCFGVRVERFSIGFGKPIWRYFDQQGTEFIISLIPFGGYVKLYSNKKETFINSAMDFYSVDDKMIGKHFAIVAAGPIANFVFAIFSYALVFMIGMPAIKPIIAGIIPNSIAESAKIIPGMEIQEIDGIETNDWDIIRMHLITKIGDDYTTFSITSPDSGKRKIKAVIDLRRWVIDPNKEDPIISLGILPYYERIEPVLFHVQLESAAYRAGLQAGDKIIKVNDQLITQWEVFSDLVRKNPEKPLLVSIERKGAPLSLTLVPDAKLIGNKHIEGFAGVAPKAVYFSNNNKNKAIRKYDAVNSTIKATNKTWQLMKITVQMLKKVIFGNIKLSSLNGPISIAQSAGESAKFGVVYYLMFLAIISVNVGVINLFPLPILDGGHLLYLAIIKLRKQPISQKIQDVSYRISFLILMLLMWIVLINDFFRVLER